MNYKFNGSDENGGLDRTKNQPFLKIKHGGLIWVRSPLRIILKSIIRIGVPANPSFSVMAGRSTRTCWLSLKYDKDLQLFAGIQNKF